MRSKGRPPRGSCPCARAVAPGEHPSTASVGKTTLQQSPGIWPCTAPEKIGLFAGFFAHICRLPNLTGATVLRRWPAPRVRHGASHAGAARLQRQSRHSSAVQRWSRSSSAVQVAGYASAMVQATQELRVCNVSHAIQVLCNVSHARQVLCRWLATRVLWCKPRGSCAFATSVTPFKCCATSSAVQVAGYASAMVQATRQLLDGAWAADRGGVRDVYADFNALTFDITLVALFGADVASSARVRLPLSFVLRCLSLSTLSPLTPRSSR